MQLSENGQAVVAPVVLRSVRFRAAPGELVAVVGVVGSGKTSLLHALLGELERLSGSVVRRGSVAYVAQTPFIANLPLRDNIVWGQPFDAERYAAVLRDCCLLDDIAMLKDGDRTEIGEAGINLSGGQRQRVSLARAVYRAADIYLLDDVLSAVDAHVGRAIFQRCITGALKGRTRVLVTHGVQYLPSCDRVVVLDGGTVAQDGPYAALAAESEAGSSFRRIVAAHEQLSVHATGDLGDAAAAGGIGSRSNSSATAPKDGGAAAPAAGKAARFTSTEKSQSGGLRGGTWKAYFDAAPGGQLMVWVLMVVYAISTALNVLQNWWLAYWTKHSGEHSEASFLGGYAGVGVAYLVGLVLRSLLTAFASTHAARRLHGRLLRGVLSSPMSFFFVTPTGRLLNRFSQDTYTLDEKLGNTLGMMLTQGWIVLATVFVISLSTPAFLAVVPVIGWMYWIIQDFFVPLSRDMKRLDAVARSPIYSHFQESLVGVTTIRAFGEVPRFCAELRRRLDSQQTAYFVTITGNRWLAVRLESVGTAIVFFAGLFVVIARKSVPAGMAGLSISYALSVTQSLNWLVRMRSDQESQIVSVERVVEYADLEPEPEGGKAAPNGWPSGGEVVAEGVTLRYHPDLPPVLHSLTFTIRRGENVGVCGRTGAGKSSLLTALLRLAHPKSVSGALRIDGVDLSHMRLRDLRRGVAVIPQESQLFLGTIKSNLDRDGDHGGDALWEALRHVRLADAVEACGGLDARVSRDGENWSHGQRQLLCTARALLRGCRVVLLDEATAACDAATDQLLQETFRQVFAGCTVISIAHRLHAIADSDRVMVLDRGRIAEFDAPKLLLSRRDSLYRKLVEEAQRADGAGAEKKA